MTSVETAEACITAKQIADFTTASSLPGNPLGAAFCHVGGCVAVRLRAAPELVPHNKARAFGLDALTDIAAIERFYGRAGLVVRIETSDADTLAAAVLTGRGYQRTSTGLTLARTTDADMVDAHSVGRRSIEQLGDDAGDAAYLDVVHRGYGLVAGSAQAQMFTCEHRTRGLSRFLVTESGQPAAAGALYVDGPTGLLAGAATLPEHRGRGHQAALIRRRIDAARRAGCRDLVVTVAPGSSSHANLVRHGFAEVHTRQLWQRRA